MTALAPACCSVSSSSLGCLMMLRRGLLSQRPSALTQPSSSWRGKTRIVLLRLPQQPAGKNLGGSSRHYYCSQRGGDGTVRRFSSSSTSGGGSGGPSSSASESTGSNRAQIPGQVLPFAVLLLPTIGLALYYQEKYNTEESQDALEQKIRERYGDDISDIHNRNQQMSAFFQAAIKDPDGTQDEKLQKILYGGKDDIKRMTPVDTKYYGTQEGVQTKEKITLELQQQELERKERRKERRRKRKLMKQKQKQAAQQEQAADTSSSSDDDKNKTSSSAVVSLIDKVDTKQVATVVVVGTMAAIAGFLIGGSRK